MNLTLKIAKMLSVENNKQIGSRLKERRKSLGMNQIELAKKLKVSQAVISNMERGEPKQLRIAEVAEALHVKPEFVINGKV
jgi:transcriptional regulator with XRE-family HTH domain